MGNMTNAYKILVRKPKEMRPLGRSRRRRDDEIGTDLTERGWESVEWTHLAQNREK
jgi:hypothetical protein